MVEADKALFLRLSDLCRTGIASDLTGAKPLEEHLSVAMAAPKVNFHLLPLPGADTGGKRQKLDNADQTVKGKGKGRKGGKGAGKGDRSKVSLPKDLVGLHSKDDKGNRLCFSYNLPTGCPNGATCTKGKHLCMKPHCYKAHPQFEHRSSA
jgi:hypothetical protein